MRIKNKIGFEKKIEVFHSFWATLSELMENAGVSENFTARIVGHKLETMTYGHYSGGIHFKKEVEAMAKVKYKKGSIMTEKDQLELLTKQVAALIKEVKIMSEALTKLTA